MLSSSVSPGEEPVLARLRYLRQNILAGSVLALLIHLLITTSTTISQWWINVFLPISAQIQGWATDQGILELNQTLWRDISSGQTHHYYLTLRSDHYLRLTVAASGVGLRAGLFDTEGRKLVQTVCRYDGPLRLSLIAGRPGTYRLNIETCETEPVTGNYQARIEENRSTTARDRNRVAAQHLIIEAEKLRAELDVAVNREALQKYQEALQLLRAINDRAAEAETLRNIGEMHQKRGERHAALRFFKQALAISQQVKDSQEESKILNDISFLQAMVGDYKKALEVCSRALNLSRANHDSHNEGQAFSNMGEAYRELGELRKALEYQRLSLRIWRHLKDRRGQAQALQRTGYVYVGLGEMQEALFAYQSALSMFRAVSDYHGQAFTLVALGHLYSQTGSKQEALNYYNQAITLSQQMEDPFLRAELYAGMSYVYFELGEPEKALWYNEQTLSLYRAMPDRWGEAAVHLSIGRIYDSMGEEQQALNYYQEAAVIIRSLSNRRLESYLLAQTGEVYEQLGQNQKALAYYKRALSLSRTGENPRGQATVLNHIGRLYERVGQNQKALNYLNQALPLTRAINDHFAESFTLFNIAHVQRSLNNLNEAKEQIEAAISVVESLRTNVASQDLRATYLASVHQYYELYVDVCMLMHKQQPAAGLDVVAFEASERAHARSLLEMLKESRADIRRGVDPALLERERSLQQELNAKAERQMQLLSSKHGEAEAIELAHQIERLTTEYDEVQAQIKATSPRYAALIQPQPLSLPEIQQQALEDNTLLLEYILGEERSYLWAVSRKRITSYELPARKEIENAAYRFYQLLTAAQPMPRETFAQRQARIKEATEQLPSQAALLSKTLLGPVSGQLAQQRLLIVSDGALQYIPFQALPVPYTSGFDNNSVQESAETTSGEPKPLIFAHEIINQPSASTLAILRKEAEQRQSAQYQVAVIADPVFESDDPRLLRAVANEPAGPITPAQDQDVLQKALRDVGFLEGPRSLPRLLASREEAEAIMTAVPTGKGFEAKDFAANRATVTSPDLARYRIIHFATHGLLNDKHPELSGIVLSLVDQYGNSQDGFLRLHDIYNLNLPVELVVLSACNTGLGKDVRGEGMISLTRGFMYAGAASVMASLWKVDDAATAELMKHFYRAMLKGGLPPAAALREAQVAMWQQKQWRSPYYWAAFVLQGEYKGRREGIHFNAQAVLTITLVVGAILMLLLSSLYAAKLRKNTVNATRAQRRQ